MRFASLALLATAAFGLAACNKGPSIDLKNATPAEVSKAMLDSGANRDLVRPGKWSSSVTIASVDTSQLPPDLAAKVNAQVNLPRVVEACITQAEVDHPERNLTQGAGNCRYEHYKMAGGEIDGHMTCSGPGGSQDMTIQGSYGHDQYKMTIATKTSGPAGNAALSGVGTTMKVESHRLADCDARPTG